MEDCGASTDVSESRRGAPTPNPKVGRTPVEVVGEAGAGEVGFDLGEDVGAEEDGRRLLADGAGQRDEDAVDLALLLVEEADELVVLLDGFEGFDEDGLAGRRTPRG